jgi:YVTN family beta-propeller protein
MSKVGSGGVRPGVALVVLGRTLLPFAAATQLSCGGQYGGSGGQDGDGYATETVSSATSAVKDDGDDDGDDKDSDGTVRANRATYSSPIALSTDGRLIWSVNPAVGTVSVIRTDKNQVIANIQVGDEPQSVALSPNGKFAFVTNTAAGSVTVIRVKNRNPDHFRAAVDEAAGPDGRIKTGAEPWNVVTSPDGLHAFVANSSEDTITVIDARHPKALATIHLRDSVCNDPDRARHFQPRGLAVTADSSKVFVTRFLSYVGPEGVQGDDNGKEGVVCRVDVHTRHGRTHFQAAAAIRIGSQVTGFKADTNGDGIPDADTRAFPNQMQSVVIRGDQAYLPNIAASPTGPLHFNVDTQAFVNVIDGVNGPAQADASAQKFLNLNLGAIKPEPGKKTLFFANQWAVAFTNDSGPGTGYAVSAGSDLLVKFNVAADGKLGFTVGANTTRYIDLNDPTNAGTSGAKAGKNPQGIVITGDGSRAYVQNFVSRNVSVVDLLQDAVVDTIQTAALPASGSQAEVVLVGAEMFFSSRGHFDRPAGTKVSTDERLSKAGWQNCASCHFKGLTDGVVWVFNTGPRKSVPLNGTFNPHDKNDQRLLNYSAVFDEVEDFEANIRNVSGPGPLVAPIPCNGGASTGVLDPNHGLLISDTGDINTAPCALNAFALPNANRQQVTVTLPGSQTHVPALTALKEWVRRAIRTPKGPRVTPADDLEDGRELFAEAGCATCHGGGKWTISTKDFVSPPAGGETFTERTPPPFVDNPVPNQYLARFLRDIGSFNLGVAGNNPIGGDIGAAEFATAQVIAGAFVTQPGGLGFDYNSDGKGNGFNVPSLLGAFNLPPYLHNGACETLACVVSDKNHRTANGTLPDRLANGADQARVVKFLETIDNDTEPFAVGAAAH